MRLSGELLRDLIEGSCPSCGYGFEIQLIDAYTQVYRRCPCCRTLIHLIDSGGSVHGAMQDVDAAMQSLTKTMKGLFR